MLIYEDGFRKLVQVPGDALVFVLTLPGSKVLEFRYDVGTRDFVVVEDFSTEREMWDAFHDLTPEAILDKVSGALHSCMSPEIPSPILH